MTSRANPFADLSDFAPQSKAKAVPVSAIEKIAEDAGFPSRKAQEKPMPVAEPVRAIRRYTTGRNRQINIKATAETIERLYRLADERNAPLGAVLEAALDALERNSQR